jgi:hypothetical protein
MAALDTVANYISRARVLLQDAVVPFRYPDADLLDALNSAFLDARRLRPDLFLPAFTTLPFFVANDSTSVPVDNMFRMAFVYYMCAQAQIRDEENTQDPRAAEFMGLWHEHLTGVKA